MTVTPGGRIGADEPWPGGQASEADDDARALDADLAFGHHLLALGDDVDPAEVEALAVSWFEGAGWLNEHALALTDESVLTGPWRVPDSARPALRLAPDVVQVFLLRCPVLRGSPPPQHLVDPNGLTGAFREGLPQGVEGDALDFLLAAARRLAGAVRIAGSGAILTPDPDADVNLCVFAPIWLEPDALIAAVRPALPSVRLAMDLEDFTPPEVPAAPPTTEVEPLADGEREWLHAESRAFDEAALAQPPVLDAYGAVAELGDDGLIEIAVEGEERVPLVLRALDWAEEGVIAYSLRWWPADEEAMYAPTPSRAFRAARGRVRARLEAAALALYAVVGGEITDEVGFLIEPESLAEE